MTVQKDLQSGLKEGPVLLECLPASHGDQHRLLGRSRLGITKNFCIDGVGNLPEFFRWNPQSFCQSLQTKRGNGCFCQKEGQELQGLAKAFLHPRGGQLRSQALSRSSESAKNSSPGRCPIPCGNQLVPKKPSVTAGGQPDPVAIATFYDPRGGRKRCGPDGVIFGHGPKAQQHGIRFLTLPPVGRPCFFRGNQKHRAAFGILRVTGAPADEPCFVSQLTETSDRERQVPTPPSRAVSIRQGGKAENFHEFAFAMMGSGWWSVEA